MDLGIKGKVALVTGGAQGIGRATALALAAEGVNVCVSDVNEDKGRQVAEEIKDFGVQSIFINGDISVESDVKNIFKQMANTIGSVDILINNAAISSKVPFDEVLVKDFERVMQVNLLGTFICSQQAFHYMKDKKWGRIVNLSSMAGRFGANKACVHYASTKGGVIAMTLTLAKKMGPYNITVNCVAPGRIDTELTRALPAAVLSDIIKQIPLDRLGSVEEVASVITFLSSEPASYVSGSCVDIIGAYIA